MRQSSEFVKSTKDWQNVIRLSLPCLVVKGCPQILCMYKILQLLLHTRNFLLCTALQCKSGHDGQ